MLKTIGKKGIVIGIMLLFFSTNLASSINVPTFISTHEVLVEENESNQSIETVPFTLALYGRAVTNPQTTAVPREDAEKIFDLFKELKVSIVSHPFDDRTQQLKEEFITLLSCWNLIPASVSPSQYSTLLNPPWFEKLRKTHNTMASSTTPVTVSAGAASAVICSLAGEGIGVLFPFVMLPRPRLVTTWSALDGNTVVGKLLTIGGFAAGGAQFGFSVGFWGIGLAYATPYGTLYGFIGYSLFTLVTAQSIERYPPDYPPEIIATDPADGESDVPLALSELQFSIEDPSGDLMSYEVTTDPDIGSGTGNLKPAGTYSIPVQGAKSSTEYHWTLKVSDDVQTTEQTFSFTTEAIAPIVSDERPTDGDRYVPETQNSLRFHLRDPQNDPMSYTVETSPFIGSGSGSDVGEKDIIVPISGLEVMTEYRWFVNVTDGENPISEEFWFRTGPLMVFDPFAEGWGYRKMITIGHTMVAGDLEHFPVVLSFSDSDIRDKAQDDGDDILFMNGVGVATRLYHEIEEFDSTTGRLIAWVNVSTISPASDTVFYMYYGNMGSADQQCPEKVWDSNYKIVYHLKDLTSSSVDDSTANNNKGTKKGGNEPNQEEGKIGNGQYFDYVDDRIDISSPAGIAITQYTISAYINLDQLTFCSAIAQSFYYKAAGLYYGYTLRSFGSTIQVANLNGGGWAEANQYITGNVLTPQQWYFIVATYDGTTARVYVNGLLIGSKALPTPTYDITKRGFIGVSDRLDGSYDYYMDGKLDEIRISSSVRSGDWILTEYNNQNNPSGFYDVGVEESHP